MDHFTIIRGPDNCRRGGNGGLRYGIKAIRQGIHGGAARPLFRALIALTTLGYPRQGYSSKGEPIFHVDPSVEGGFLYGTTTGDHGEGVSLYGGGVMVGVSARLGQLSLGGQSALVLHPTAGSYGARTTDGAGSTLLSLGANFGSSSKLGSA